MNILQRKQQHILMGSISLIGMRGFGVISQVVVTFCLSRMLSIEIFGFWSVLQSIMILLSLLDLGTTGALQNELIQNKESNPLASSILFLSFSYMGLVFAVIIAIFMILLPLDKWIHVTDESLQRQLEWVVCYVILTQGVKLALQTSKAGYFAYQETYLYSAFEIVFSFLSMGYLVYCYFSHASIFHLFYGFFSLSMFLSIASFLFFMKRRNWQLIKIPFQNQINHLKNMSHTIGCLSLVNLFCIFIFSTDLVLISILRGLEEVAEFSLLQKLYSGILLVTLPITTASWTSLRLSYDKKDYRLVKQMVQKITLVIVAITLCIGCIMMLFYPSIIYLWTGKWLYNPVLSVLLFAYTFLLGLNSIFTTYLLATGQYKHQLIVNGCMAVFNIVWSLVLARHMGSAGVVLATNLTILFLLVINVGRFFQTLEEKSVLYRL